MIVFGLLVGEMIVALLVFFFKQKTAHEVRISDWSSDVCSSDLGCMSDVLRSSFSYQVAVGSTMSPYRQVVLMRKSSTVSKSSLPSAASSRYRTCDEIGRAHV